MFLSGKNSAPSTASRGKDALKRLDGSIKYHLCFPCQAREFANTIPLDVDGDTAALQYFRFEHLHSKATPFPSMHRPAVQNAGPAAKVFGKEGRGEGEPFSKKVSLPASFSSFKSPSVCLPSPKQKNPRRSGDKKRPPRAMSCKGVSNNLWQRPTFPHDVMQYHRRWRA